jgi:hypothetical protein
MGFAWPFIFMCFTKFAFVPGHREIMAVLVGTTDEYGEQAGAMASPAANAVRADPKQPPSGPTVCHYGPMPDETEVVRGEGGGGQRPLVHGPGRATVVHWVRR